MKQTLKLLTLALSAIGAFIVLSTASAHAATLTVATGNDENINNSSCSLTEAIENINDGMSTNTDCIATGGGYGTNDTINIPAGTITLIANLPTITKSIAIEGAGMSSTVINGNSQWTVFKTNSDPIDTLSVKKMKIIAFQEAAINTNSGSGDDLLNLEASELEIDGTGSVVGSDVIIGIQMLVQGSGAHTFTIDNVYIHDLKGAAGGTVAGLMMGSANNTLTANITNVTINNLENTDAGSQAIAVVNGPFSNMAPGDLQANISNVTVDNIISSTDIAGGIGVLSFVAGGNTNAVINASAMTIRGISGQQNTLFPVGASGIFVAGMAAAPSDSSTATVNLTNVLFANNVRNGAPQSCSVNNLNSAFSGSGTVTATITSNGGNLSDDTTCSPYFTQPTDQNNVGTLASTLGTLSNNGGFVPTIPLLANSPAVDAGVAVAGLTQDARLAIRPQGNAFDSGAYESPFTRATQTSAALASTGGDTWLILASSLSLIGVGAGYLLLKFKQGRS